MRATQAFVFAPTTACFLSQVAPSLAREREAIVIGEHFTSAESSGDAKVQDRRKF